MVTHVEGPVTYDGGVTGSRRRSLMRSTGSGTLQPDGGGGGAGGEAALPHATPRVVCRRVERVVRAHRPSCSAAIRRLASEVAPQLDAGADDEACVAQVMSLLQLGTQVTN